MDLLFVSSKVSLCHTLVVLHWFLDAYFGPDLEKYIMYASKQHTLKHTLNNVFTVNINESLEIELRG